VAGTEEGDVFAIMAHYQELVRAIQTFFTFGFEQFPMRFKTKSAHEKLMGGVACSLVAKDLLPVCFAHGVLGIQLVRQRLMLPGSGSPAADPLPGETGAGEQRTARVSIC